MLDHRVVKVLPCEPGVQMPGSTSEGANYHVFHVLSSTRGASPPACACRLVFLAWLARFHPFSPSPARSSTRFRRRKSSTRTAPSVRPGFLVHDTPVFDPVDSRQRAHATLLCLRRFARERTIPRGGTTI